jgi:hypothetical protein
MAKLTKRTKKRRSIWSHAAVRLPVTLCGSTNVFMQGLWPVAIVPPVALARIRVAVGSAWKRAGLAHYFQNTAKEKKQ